MAVTSSVLKLCPDVQTEQSSQTLNLVMWHNAGSIRSQNATNTSNLQNELWAALSCRLMYYIAGGV